MIKERRFGSSFVFSYLKKELHDVVKDRFDHSDPCWAIVQWAKKRGLIDNPDAVRTMSNICEDLEGLIKVCPFSILDKKGVINKAKLLREFFKTKRFYGIKKRKSK